MAADEVVLDDALEGGRVAFAIPGALGIDDGDWTAFADAQAVGLRPQDAALLRKPQLLEPPLKKVPGRKAAILVAALRRRLIGAEKNVPARHRDADGLRNGLEAQGLRLMAHGLGRLEP